MDSLELGLLLQKYRLDRHLSLYEMADILKYRASQLEKIEAGDFSVLGEPFFVKGFVRTYLQYFGVGADECANILKKLETLGQPVVMDVAKSGDASTEAAQQTKTTQAPVKTNENTKPKIKTNADRGIDISTSSFVFLMVLAVAGLIAVSWWRSQSSKEQSQLTSQSEPLVIASAATIEAPDVAASAALPNVVNGMSGAMVGIPALSTDIQSLPETKKASVSGAIEKSDQKLNKIEKTETNVSSTIKASVAAASLTHSTAHNAVEMSASAAKEDGFHTVEVTGNARQVALGFTLDEETWIEFRRGSRILMSRSIKAGASEAPFRFSLPVEVSFPKPRQVRLTINGKPYSLKDHHHKQVVRLRLVTAE